jgi:hypothetical protein
MRVRLSRILIIGVFLAGCSHLEPLSEKEMESRMYEGPYELVYNAVVAVLSDRGYEIVRADPAQGIVETGVVEAKYMRTQIKAEVKPLGKQKTQVRLRMDLAESGLLTSKYTPAQPKVSTYDKLFEEIEIQFYREHFLKIERRSREKQ